VKYRDRVVVRAVDWDDPAAESLRAAQRVEIAERYGRPDSEPGPAPTAADIAYFVVALDPDGTPAGCGGLRPLDARTGEIKRMYVVPQRRGTGVAAAVLQSLEEHARALGWTRLRLETGNEQPDAVAFYAKHGYRAIPRFGHYADEPTSLCFERVLS
jgi:GNAT superfamily N-acetyltransferase